MFKSKYVKPNTKLWAGQGPLKLCLAWIVSMSLAIVITVSYDADCSWEFQRKINSDGMAVSEKYFLTKILFQIVCC